MTKERYLQELKRGLRNYPSSFQSEILEAFEEHFQSGLEAGHSEEEVMLSLGTIEEVLENIKDMEQTPVTLVDLKPTRKISIDINDDEDEEETTSKTKKRPKLEFKFDSDEFASFGEAMDFLTKGEAMQEIKDSLKELKNLKIPKVPKPSFVYSDFDEDDIDEEIVQGPMSMEGFTKVEVESTTGCDIEIYPSETGEFVFKPGRGIFTSSIPKLITSTEGDVFKFKVVSNAGVSFMNSSSKLTLLLPPSFTSIMVKGYSGDVDVTGLTLDDIIINSTNGDITLKTIGAKQILASSMSGDFEAMNINCEQLTLKTTNGDIEANDIQVERVELKSVNGDITVEDIETEDLLVNSINGDVEITGVVQNSQISCVSGDIDITFEQDLIHCELDTKSGDINLNLCKQDNVSIYAKTMSGDIRNRTGLTSNKESKHSARIGDGDNQIVIKALSGDIVIR